MAPQATVGAMVGIPPLFSHEFIALPFAIGCGFAGGGLRELCPKDVLWQFSPFVFTSLHRRAWQMLRSLKVDWQVMLLLAPIGLEIIRQLLGARYHRLFFMAPGSPHSVWLVIIVFATVLAVATPIKIWNNARIEHRLQEQEKLLLAAKLEALANQINPHFLFNTLTSISSLIRTQPETARVLITKLSGLAAPAEHRPLRHPARGLEAIDECLHIETARFGPQLKVVKQIQPATLDVIVPSLILQPLIQELDQARPVAEGRRRPDHHRRRLNGHDHRSRGRRPGHVRRRGRGCSDAASASTTSTSACGRSTAPSASCGSRGLRARAWRSALKSRTGHTRTRDG
jgi:two-component system LytT family sensor kinase